VAEPKEYPYRPSVDTFFYSLLDNWGAKDAAVLLTGMGKDGADGLSRLKESGWMTIAQDEKSSIVFGMPKAAIELNAAVKVLDPERIAGELINLYAKKGI